MAGAAGFEPSLTVAVGGLRVGLVGFSNPDIPELTRPGALGPYRVGDPVAAVNAEAERLRAEGVAAVVAMGHMGATGGTIDEPTGPVVDVAPVVAVGGLVTVDGLVVVGGTSSDSGVRAPNRGHEQASRLARAKTVNRMCNVRFFIGISFHSSSSVLRSRAVWIHAKPNYPLTKTTTTSLTICSPCGVSPTARIWCSPASNGHQRR